MRGNRPKWFGHNAKRKNDGAADKISKIKMKGNGERSGPNKIWMEVIREGKRKLLKEIRVDEEMLEISRGGGCKNTNGKFYLIEIKMRLKKNFNHFL